MCGWKPNKTDDIPDFWYEPQKIGFLLQVKAYEITDESKGFRPCDKTLRFPRVEAARWAVAARTFLSPPFSVCTFCLLTNGHAPSLIVHQKIQ